MKTITVSNEPGNNADYTSLYEAFSHLNEIEGPVTIRLKKGVYHEVLTLSKSDVTIEGEDPENTVISMNRYAKEILQDGLKRGTFRTQTLLIDGDRVTLRNLTVENTAGCGAKYGQAIALYVDGDDCRFENVRLLGQQDTLFLAPLPPKEVEPGGFRGPKQNTPRTPRKMVFRDSFIAGNVDFIFGGGAAFFESCIIHSVNDPLFSGTGYVTAASTPESIPYGFVFNKCRFTSDCGAGSFYLGRPWREYAKTVFIDCEYGPHIKQEGFADWSGRGASGTVFYAEYCREGQTGRAPFAKALSEEESRRYLAGCNDYFFAKE
ncbi:MAG: pectin methylesterase [Lachnospiraceae bacterium]|nr:pectin methylesterase [Lachnospiraceae bacterium]